MPMPSSNLLPYIFSNTRLALAVQFAHWVQASPRFRVFAETYRDKIRKKVRGLTDADGYRDLEAELATAFSLVQERRFMVEYEMYGVGKQRGPDFSVTYKTHIRFDVEVTRLRGGSTGTSSDKARLANTLCVKLGQLPPSIINILVLSADEGTFNEEDEPDPGSPGQSPAGRLQSAVTLLQEKADRKEDDFFTRRGYMGARDFLKHYSRLSAIRLVIPDSAPLLRLQPQARHPLPPDLATLLRK